VPMEESLRNPDSGRLRDLASRAFGHPGLQAGFNELPGTRKG
jgi:hypothetical protein